MEKIFIKNPNGKKQYDDSFFSPAIRFRRKFMIKTKCAATLSVCGLGYGYCYINGQAVTDDLLTSPVSDYRKTLWFNSYDITDLLNEGENTICVHLGNGFYNENLETAWMHCNADWRDVPKVCLELSCGDFTLRADESFRTSIDMATYYNQIHVGEFYDANMDEDWLAADYDDSAWEFAQLDDNPPEGQLRPCKAEPIRELHEYGCIEILKNEDGYVLDFGQNLSGYVCIRVSQPKNTVLTLAHAEQIDRNNNLKLNDLDIFYKPFQIDKITCSGKEFTWSPKFTYHGFRYVQIAGLTGIPQKEDFKAVFIHQDVKKNSTFSCSLPLINQIYQAGIMSSWSNMHYALTDCPSREKLGWTNDASASCEQLFYNFDIGAFMRKWAQDMCDAIEPDGSTYGIIPTHGWGHDLGPVCDAILYKLPYYHYIHYRDKSILELMLPACLDNLQFSIAQFESNRDYWLGDWTGFNSKPTPTELIFAIYLIEFIDRTSFMLKNTGKTLPDRFANYREKYRALIEEKYITDGLSNVEEQTAIAMLICHGFGSRALLGKQLANIIKEKNQCRLDVGMVGIQYIFDAMSLTGNQDLLVEMLAQPDAPAFAAWFDEGATTLYENFTDGHTNSKNHHMFSSILAWIIKYVLGIKLLESGEVEISPLKFERIKRASGKVTLLGKEIFVEIEDGKVI